MLTQKEPTVQKTKVNWGIIGTANIALGSVGPGINLAENAKLTAIAGRNPEKTEKHALALNPEVTYNSYDDLLAAKDIQAVYIPLPNGLHKEWILKALRAGKHVLCEKPMCLTLKDTREVFEEAEKQGLYLAEAFAYMQNPMIGKARELLNSGAIGKLKSIDSHFYFRMDDDDNIRWVKELGGGAANDLGCYPISLIRYLIDEEPVAMESQSLLTTGGVDMRTSGFLNFPGDIHAVYHVGFDTEFSFGCTAFGTEGQLVIDEPFNQKGILTIKIQRPDGVEIVEVNSPDNYQLEVEDLSRCILEGGTLLTTRKHSEGNARILEDIYSRIS